MTSLKYFWHKKSVLSFLAILLIVTIHNSATNQYHLPPDGFTDAAAVLHQIFAYGLSAIAVPLFFFISGFTFFRNYQPRLYPSKLKTRFHSLVVPYLIWNTIALIIAIIYTYTPLSQVIAGREIFTPSVANVLSGIFLYKYNYTFWFLYNLIIFVVLSPVFDLLLRRKWLSLLSSAVFLILPLFASSFLGIDFSFIVFYFLGCFFGRYHLDLFARKSRRQTSLFAGIIFIGLLLIQFLKVFQVITLPILASQIILVLLVLSLWFFADLFVPKLKPRPIYSEVFPVYILHPFLIAAITKLIYLAAPEVSCMVLVNEIASSILAIVISLVIARFWHQKLPRSYHLLFGSR